MQIVIGLVPCAVRAILRRCTRSMRFPIPLSTRAAPALDRKVARKQQGARCPLWRILQARPEQECKKKGGEHTARNSGELTGPCFPSVSDFRVIIRNKCVDLEFAIQMENPWNESSNIISGSGFRFDPAFGCAQARWLCDENPAFPSFIAKIIYWGNRGRFLAVYKFDGGIK